MRIRIAENIKKYRIARGFTQSELALLLSVSPQAVSRWENGQAFPDITHVWLKQGRDGRPWQKAPWSGINGL